MLKPKIIVADTETIGLHPPPKPASGVVQVAWTELDPVTLETIEVRQHLVNPMAPIHPEASKVHGLYAKDVEGAPVLEDVFYLKGPTVVIGHNIAFDMKFVGHAIENLAGNLCTLKLARHLIKDSSNHKLPTLVEHLKLEAGKAHDAGGDVISTVNLLRRLVEISGRTLEQLIAADKPRVFHVMPFGKHKGTLINNLPLNYISWFLDQEIDQDLRYTLEMQMKVR